MGAWGAGNFENDDALYFVGELTSGAIEQRVRDALAAVHLVDDAEVDATVAAQALVAAELVAASRGHLADDFPADAVSLTKGLKAADLKDLACDAVSRVLLSSELVELWAESDESEEWNRAITGLIERLGKKPRKKPAPEKPTSKVTACQCSFCLEQIPADELVDMTLRMPLTPGTMERTIYTHAGCLNAGLHPSRIQQWWRLDPDK
ncbi:MAG: DUF4259 domain-containing protein [Acidobacteria bacterium]|nr:DUF4259 domain-containing protein [Acidobacteriota bacterium]